MNKLTREEIEASLAQLRNVADSSYLRCPYCGCKNPDTHAISCPIERVAGALLALAVPSEAEEAALRSVLVELLRLYDWRFELSELERNGDGEGGHRLRRLLHQYGEEKRRAWIAARAALKSTAAPQDGGSQPVDCEHGTRQEVRTDAFSEPPIPAVPAGAAPDPQRNA